MTSLWQRRHNEDGETGAEEGAGGDLDAEKPAYPRHSPPPVRSSLDGVPTSHITAVQVTRRTSPRPAPRPGEGSLHHFSTQGLVRRISSDDTSLFGKTGKLGNTLESHAEALLPRPAPHQVTRKHVPASRHQYHSSIPFAQPSHPRGPPGIVVVPVPHARRVKNYPSYVLPTPAPERRRKVLDKGNEEQGRTLMHDLLTPHRSFVFRGKHPHATLPHQRVDSEQGFGGGETPSARARGDTAERQAERRARKVAAWQAKVHRATLPHEALRMGDPARSFHKSTIQWYLGDDAEEEGAAGGSGAEVHSDLCAPFRNKRRPIPAPTQFRTAPANVKEGPRSASPQVLFSRNARGVGDGAFLTSSYDGAERRLEMGKSSDMEHPPANSPASRGNSADWSRRLEVASSTLYRQHDMAARPTARLSMQAISTFEDLLQRAATPLFGGTGVYSASAVQPKLVSKAFQATRAVPCSRHGARHTGGVPRMSGAEAGVGGPDTRTGWDIPGASSWMARVAQRQAESGERAATSMGFNPSREVAGMHRQHPPWMVNPAAFLSASRAAASSLDERTWTASTAEIDHQFDHQMDGRGYSRGGESGGRRNSRVYTDDDDNNSDYGDIYEEHSEGGSAHFPARHLLSAGPLGGMSNPKERPLLRPDQLPSAGSWGRPNIPERPATTSMAVGFEARPVSRPDSADSLLDSPFVRNPPASGPRASTADAPRRGVGGKRQAGNAPGDLLARNASLGLEGWDTR